MENVRTKRNIYRLLLMTIVMTDYELRKLLREFET